MNNPIRMTLLATPAILARMALGGVSIQSVGTLPGMQYSGAGGVSPDGAVVTGSSFNGVSPQSGHAYRWQSGSMQDLGVLQTGLIASGTDASSGGAVIVGESALTQFPGQGTHAFRWTAGGGMQDLGTLNGVGESHARGVSADGQAVVGWSHDSAFQQRAFRWTTSGMQSLGVLSGGTVSNAFAVSADGSVIVGSGNASGFSSMAFRWTTAGMVPLGTLSGDSSSEAHALSADGSIVFGTSSSAGHPNTPYAFRWTSAGGMQPLDASNPTIGAIPWASSADGSAVVGNLAGSEAGFLWTPSLGVRSLQSYLPGLGIDLTGWSLGQATGISDDGTTIVGTGSYQGVQSGWIVTIPGPGVLAGFGIGSLALGCRRRRHLPRPDRQTN